MKPTVGGAKFPIWKRFPSTTVTAPRPRWGSRIVVDTHNVKRVGVLHIPCSGLDSLPALYRSGSVALIPGGGDGVGGQKRVAVHIPHHESPEVTETPPAARQLLQLVEHRVPAAPNPVGAGCPWVGAGHLRPMTGSTVSPLAAAMPFPSP